MQKVALQLSQKGRMRYYRPKQGPKALWMEGTFQQGRPKTREMMKDISLPCVGVSLSLVGGEGGKHPVLVLPTRPSQAAGPAAG